MPTAANEIEVRILDAALARIQQVGIRRASLDDIAKRAGISRVTIFRKFTTKENLVDAVLAREIQRMLAQLAAVATTTRGIDARIEATVMHVLRQTHSHPLVKQMLAVAPEEILSFYTVRGDQAVALGISYIVSVLERAQHGGTIDRYDPRPVAELLARLVHSLLLTPVGGIDFADESHARVFVARSIVPIVKHGLPASSKGSTHESPGTSPPSTPPR